MHVYPRPVYVSADRKVAPRCAWLQLTDRPSILGPQTGKCGTDVFLPLAGRVFGQVGEGKQKEREKAARQGHFGWFDQLAVRQ